MEKARSKNGSHAGGTGRGRGVAGGKKGEGERQVRPRQQYPISELRDALRAAAEHSVATIHSQCPATKTSPRLKQELRAVPREGTTWSKGHAFMTQTVCTVAKSNLQMATRV